MKQYFYKNSLFVIIKKQIDRSLCTCKQLTGNTNRRHKTRLLHVDLVKQKMPVQPHFERKRLSALVAPEGALAGVQAHVRLQVVRQRELPMADLALVILNPGVHAHVRHREPLERLAANRAQPRTTFRPALVRLHVLRERRAVHERLAARLALLTVDGQEAFVRLPALLHMCPQQMLQEQRFAFETLRANRALVRIVLAVIVGFGHDVLHGRFQAIGVQFRFDCEQRIVACTLRLCLHLLAGLYQCIINRHLSLAFQTVCNIDFFSAHEVQSFSVVQLRQARLCAQD